MSSDDSIDWKTDPRHDTNIRRKTERKWELFRPYVRECDCLDIGAAGGSAGFVTDEYWLHGWLVDQCASVVGIDIDEAGVETARNAGYDLHEQSAESFELEETFDVVVAANVIEHLACPGGMLESAREHLNSEGHLLVTTPRTHTPWNLLRQLKNDRGITPHPEHTMWFCRSTLTALLERTGFEVVEYQSWGFDRVGMSTADSLWRAFEKLLATLPPLREISDYQHFVVAKPADDN